MINTKTGVAEPIANEESQVDGGESDDDDADEYDDYGNKAATHDDQDDSEMVSAAQREFDLSDQLANSLAGVPEQLQPLLLAPA